MKLAKGLVGLAAALGAGQAFAADLSPGHWPAAQRAQLQRLEFFGQPPFAGSVGGARILVTGTSSPVAVHAGAEALRQGGSAADAAATVALTQIATDLRAPGWPVQRRRQDHRRPVHSLRRHHAGDPDTPAAGLRARSMRPDMKNPSAGVCGGVFRP